jgi:hypothetical protein
MTCCWKPDECLPAQEGWKSKSVFICVYLWLNALNQVGWVNQMAQVTNQASQLSFQEVKNEG